ncbi:hypothetical protein V9K67_21450 [Paraflavisolibacter sp. H34]|uniref:hypothetical protein n=1 Tax=Huijunlia imazamoxiresistens TaxID=3127457 RepID=UPI0030188F91
MKKVLISFLALGLSLFALPLRGQVIVSDPMSYAQLVTNATQAATQATAQITHLRAMTKWISNTWEKSNEAIKTYKRSKEFWQKSQEIVDNMGNIKGWVQRDGAIMNQNFRKEADETVRVAGGIMADGVNYITMAVSKDNLDYSQRIELVNKALGKLEEALWKINRLKVKVEDDYIATSTIEMKQDLRNSLYKAFSNK